MNSMWFFVIIGLIVVAGIAYTYLAAEKRRKELAQLADRAGLVFAPDCGDVYQKYVTFTPFSRGAGWSSSNLLAGERGEVHWELFDYRYTTGSGKNRQTHHCGIAAATVPIWFRKLQIRPEDIFDKVAAFVGYDDINFESNEFSRRYHVSCDVRKFAYDVIHPQMIEFLLARPAHHWQLADNVILIHKSSRYSAADLEQVLTMVEGFIERIPGYVREDAQLRAPAERPL